jgi:hypothetical protein
MRVKRLSSSALQKLASARIGVSSLRSQRGLPPPTSAPLNMAFLFSLLTLFHLFSVGGFDAVRINAHQNDPCGSTSDSVLYLYSDHKLLKKREVAHPPISGGSSET